MTAYTVRAYREGDWWALEIPDAEVFTQCRRLDQAADVAREAIALKYDAPEDDILIADVTADIGDDITALRDESRQKALAAEEASRQAAALARHLVAEIRSRGYSLRDIATMLNDSGPALRQPRQADPRWQEKIAQSMQAREMGRALRSGKPASFRRSVGRTR